MKNLLLKVPTSVFTILVLAPLLILAYTAISNETIVKANKLTTLFAIASAVKIVWLFAIVDYFQSKLDNFNYLKLIYFLLLVDGLLTFSIFFIIDSPDLMTGLALYLLPIGIHIATTVFVTLLVRKVFFDRSVWFIVIKFSPWQLVLLRLRRTLNGMNGGGND